MRGCLMGVDHVTIVGAGIMGLTLGFRLSEAGVPVTVLERENEVGGLARSFFYDGYTFDIGPHRFHLEDSVVNQFLDKVLLDESVLFERRSGVYFSGRYFDWPLRPSGIIRLPAKTLLNVAKDLFSRTSREGNSFEDYVLAQYGRTLFDLFFDSYTKKFIGLDSRKVHSDWAVTGMKRAAIDKRVKVGNLVELARTALLPSPVKTMFSYPCKGVQVFPKRLADGVMARGGKVKLGRACDDVSDGLVVWTAPIPDLASQLGLEEPDLEYLSLVLFNVQVDGVIENPYQWCYFGGDDTLFNRVSDPRLFSPEMVPAGKSSLCAEITCMAGDNTWVEAEELAGQVASELIKVGLIPDFSRIEAIHVERVRNAYPIYKLNYRDEIAKFKRDLEGFPNIVLAGRSGLFWYNNMDHSIRMGLDLADDILGASKNSVNACL